MRPPGWIVKGGELTVRDSAVAKSALKIYHEPPLRGGSESTMGVYGQFEIEITDFKEDPASDAACEIFFDIRGPVNFYEMAVVLFEEDFMVRYFRIPWYKDLPTEERRIWKEKRPLFIRWALMKAEEKIRKQIQDVKISVHFEGDAAWAEKVEQGLLRPSSEERSPNLFILKL